MNLAASIKGEENVWSWLAKIASGALIFIVLVVHLIVNHLVAPGGLMTYSDIVRYLSNPWIAAMETGFLVLVVTHALLGARSILLDLRPSSCLMRVADLLLVSLGIVAISYGIWLLRAIY